MPRYYPGTEITLRNYVRVDETLTDASAITFTWRMGSPPAAPDLSLAQFLAGGSGGDQTSVTPTRESVGTYAVQIIPLTGGNLYYRWDTEGDLDTAREGVLSIAETQFTL